MSSRSILVTGAGEAYFPLVAELIASAGASKCPQVDGPAIGVITPDPSERMKARLKALDCLMVEPE